MYLCDQMSAITQALGPDDPFISNSPMLSWMLARMKETINSSDIYIMERTALAAGGRFRLGDPDRLEMMLGLVLGQPGRIFIEWME